MQDKVASLPTGYVQLPMGASNSGSSDICRVVGNVSAMIN